MRSTNRLVAIGSAALLVAVGVVGQADAQTTQEPTNSLMAEALRQVPSESSAADQPVHALRATSMFAVLPPEPRRFALHDLIQIIVLESTRATSSQSLETAKEYDLGARFQIPDLRIDQLLQGQILSQSSHIPVFQIENNKEFKGEGDYERRDNMTARVTAEVIEILPNGNLVIEARRVVETDGERSTLSATGICRPEDVTAVNTVLSNQIHDLTIEMKNSGNLRYASKKGIIAKALDAIFAF